MWCREGVNASGMAFNPLAGPSSKQLGADAGGDDKNNSNSSISDSDEELDAVEDSLDMNFSGGEHEEAENHANDYMNFHAASLFNPTSASPLSNEAVSFNS